MSRISQAALYSIVIGSITLLASSWARGAGEPNGRMVLDDCIIVVRGEQPAYVTHAVNELKGYLAEIAGGAGCAGQGETAAGCTVISVGPPANPQGPGGAWSLDHLGAEGYLIRSARDGQNHKLVVAGATPKGTRNGLQALMRMIRAEGTSAYLAADVNVASKPAFAVRGLHFNGWMFNSPYSFRTWTEAEWKSYIDTLGCQHVNLLYLWPFMEIIPLPLSPEDTAYLEEVRRVVQYAQDAHGMEVWIMQAANRVAKHNAGVADPRFRPYWRADVQTDRDPGDPEEFKAIMASHAALYEIVNNVDGVCTIDTDPGSYPGSTLEEYTAILKGCRELLDQYNVHGRQAKLIHWMWLGWGGEERREELSWQRQTLDALQAQVPEPWWLVAGQEIYLPVIQEANALGKTVFLRYGTIESEPSYPLTQEPAYVLGEIDKMFGFAREYPGLLGVMGNTQCPILQGVGIYHHLLCSWDMGRLDLSQREILLEIAELLYPERKELIADAFEGLNWNGSHRPIERLIAELDQAVAEDRLGRPGVIGRKLFPTHQIVAESLLLQLRLKAALQRLYAELQRTSSREECFRLMEDCLDAHLAWHNAHGWHKLWGSERAALGRFRQDDRFRASLRRLRSVLGTDESVHAFFAEMAERLAAKHGRESAVADATGPTVQALLREVAHEPSLASEARVTASVVPGVELQSFTIHDQMTMVYLPGPLNESNDQWLELSWEEAREFDTVNVHFRRDDSLWNRTIRLQRQTAAGVWEDIGACQPADERHLAVARFKLDTPIVARAIRIVNLFEIAGLEVRNSAIEK